MLGGSLTFWLRISALTLGWLGGWPINKTRPPHHWTVDVEDLTRTRQATMAESRVSPKCVLAGWTRDLWFCLAGLLSGLMFELGESIARSRPVRFIGSDGFTGRLKPFECPWLKCKSHEEAFSAEFLLPGLSHVFLPIILGVKVKPLLHSKPATERHAR